MAATISVPAVRVSNRAARLITIGIQLVVTAVMAALAQRSLLAPAMAVLLLVETWTLLQGRQWAWGELWRRATPLIVGASFIVLMALLPKALTQIALTFLYAGWRSWRVLRPVAAPMTFWELLALQAVVLEALFLAADFWHLSRPFVLVMIWLGCYVLVHQALVARGERAAGALAAAWALVATEASWVFLTWLVSYVAPGYYVIVPQATLVLTALAYCFGNIYLAQRTGNLNRTRFTEYLLIGLILIWIVISGTHWRPTL